MNGQRAAVIAEARSWIGTKYHTGARVKGAGADCLTLLCDVFEAVGVVGHIDPGFYPPDFHLHRDEERYLEGLLRYAHEISGPPEAGDVALFKMGRCFAHGAIVTAWPKLIHALAGAAVLEGDATQPPLRGRAVRFFSPFRGA